MVQKSLQKARANGEGFSPSFRHNGRVRDKSDHVVQFHNDGADLVDTVVEFVGSALQAGEGAVVLATRKHRDMFNDRLRSAGVDVESASASGRYVSLDAADALAQIMVDGRPDRESNAVVGDIVERMLTFVPRINAFGELVSLLWSAGEGDAAVALEKLWNKLIESHAVSLHCAYAVDDLGNHVSRDHFLDVCAEHRGIIHAPSYVGLALAR